MTDKKEKIKDYLNEILGDNSENIPEYLIDFWCMHYGQVVNKILVDREGHSWHVDKVLTVDAKEEVNQDEISWRNNSSPAELDYSVPYLESILSNWEENDTFIPILAVESQERNMFDLVVINITNPRKISVSIWVHEENDDVDEPYLIEVSDSWDEFLEKWKQA